MMTDFVLAEVRRGDGWPRRLMLRGVGFLLHRKVLAMLVDLGVGIVEMFISTLDNHEMIRTNSLYRKR